MSGKEMEYSLAGIAEWQIQLQNVAWRDCSSHNYMWHLCCVIGGVAKKFLVKVVCHVRIGLTGAYSPDRYLCGSQNG